jgi:hypothetical protein
LEKPAAVGLAIELVVHCSDDEAAMMTSAMIDQTVTKRVTSRIVDVG